MQLQAARELRGTLSSGRVDVCAGQARISDTLMYHLAVVPLTRRLACMAG